MCSLMKNDHEFQRSVSEARSTLRTIVDHCDHHCRSYRIVRQINVRIDGVIVLGNGLCNIQRPGEPVITPTLKGLPTV